MAKAELVLEAAGIPTVPPTYRWKTQRGLELRPHVMETRHVHHALVMLWHHLNPDRPVRASWRRYRFGDHFTPEYIELSIRALALELSARDDLAPWMERELLAIFRHLHADQERLDTQRRLFQGEIFNG